MAMSVGQLETTLARHSYGDIDDELQKYDDDTLIDLLDSRSIKVGSTAADILSRRGKSEAVIDAFFSQRIRTKSGKQRVLFFVRILGKNCTRAKDVCLALIGDKSAAVVDDALFGLVFLQDRDAIGAIRDVMAARPEDSKIRDRCLLAIRALELQDPFVYSPHFHDGGDVWSLDK